ncbi:hypothetical protein QN224_21095 [Sinorhizobium sp. 8-89]|nr:hypothetical protein [Sinorhizobium sp. 7-81]MDK1387917.1 hypothetical protein [Sinorhizobium sp. 7-81]
MAIEPIRVPAAEAVLAALDPETAYAELAPVLSRAFSNFSFTATTLYDA